MRLKPVPDPPADLDALREFQRAIPLVPGDTDDCCARLRRRRDLSDRQTANDWLAFLRALDLVEETSRGFSRADAEPTPDRVREGLCEEVLLVPEALATLDAASPDDPVTATDLFAATRDRVPRHDRARDPDWEARWRDRAARLLGWLALVDLAAPVGDGSDSPEAETGYVAGDAR